MKLLFHPAHWIAFGFGSGLSRVVPGTVGTLWAWLTYFVASFYLDQHTLGTVILGSFLIGIVACKITTTHLGQYDHSSIVWDEIVAFWLILWVMTPASVPQQLAAFCIFRLLDILKPGPIGWIDQKFHGLGWRGSIGIMLDDLIAAFCTLVILAIWRVTQ